MGDMLKPSVTTFNSLFEMPAARAKAMASAVKPAFNSLFEMLVTAVVATPRPQL